MKLRRSVGLILALWLLLNCAACGLMPQLPVSAVPDLSQEGDLVLLEDEPAEKPDAAPEAETAETEKTEADAPSGETQTDDAAEPEALPDVQEPAEPEEQASAGTEEQTNSAEAEEQPSVTEDGIYDSRDEVALYIHLYGHLPDNYITKNEAQALGWTGGSLEPYAPGKCIGGGYFGNYEGLLPKKQGRTYTECDIDTMGARSRGSRRIVFSNDGLIYYTGDHYVSFTLLYGEDAQ